jgi:hypothetical protein
VFAESLLYLVSRAPRAARRFGLLTEAVGLWSRGKRRRHEWAAHEARCHALVDQAVAGLTRRRKALILGSGLVRDVPIDSLLAAFEQIILVDAVHLPHVRWRFRHHAKVVLIERDLTGCLDWLVGTHSNPVDPFADFRGDAEVDLVISANLLSQLPIRIEEWLESNPARAALVLGRFMLDRGGTGQGSDDGNDLHERFLRSLIEDHLAALSRFQSRVCLLSDVMMSEQDRAGTETDQLDLMRGVKLPVPDAQWDWVVAPFGEIERDKAYIHRVHGYGDWHKAVASL